MQLYLLRKQELSMTSLPSRVSGQYTIDYTTDNGNVQTLVRINAKDDKWYISENKSVRINGSNSNGEYREYELVENAVFYMQKDKTENMILMVEPDAAGRERYSMYQVPHDGIIEIGRSSRCHIQYQKAYVNEDCHVRICYNGNIPEKIENCAVTSNKGKTNPVYRNNHYISAEESAHIGDVIFLFGMKIILGNGFIAVNNPDGQSNVHLQEKNMKIFIPIEQEDGEEESGKQTFSSAPRNRKEFVHKTFKIESPPEGLKGDETPWIVMLGPSITMAMGSLFSSVITINNVVASSGTISSALPSLVTSIVMVMGSAVWPIIGRRVQHRSQVRKAVIASDDYEEYLLNLQKEIEEAIQQQAEILKENNPLLDECIKMIVEVRENLWERSQRHPDFLEMKVGQGDVPLNADFSYPERGYQSEISESAKNMYDLVAKNHIVENVPITIPLKTAGIVGVIGDRPDICSFAKALLIELTAMHNYEDLKLIFIYNETERRLWEFVKWIPHLWNNENTMRYLANDPDEVKILSDLINNLKPAGQNGKYNGPHYVIFAADKTLAERAQSIKEFYQKPEEYSNMTMIALYNERQYLPKTCSYVIDLIHSAERRKNPEKYKGQAAAVSDFNDITGKKIICRERIHYEQDPEEIFTKMANIYLDSPESAKQLPSQYTFMEMFEVGKAEHLDLIRRWREKSAVASLAAPIGIDTDGYLINLDIHEKAHGPHGIIAGMTGSGKSEFIISYIASMAVNYSPEDVAFVLIDFKGGGMADIFKNLPHTAGLITNLDGNELRRSFLAIEHELEKRQKLFKEISEQKKISNIDIYKYQKLRREDSSLKPLPHLILVSDEFAELKQQHGDFMGQLIRIARIGRSLGVHLILATQKPAGVVDEQINSNIRFRICLKVQDKSDSQSMIGRPDAALITNAGRFYLQVGHDEVFEYGQSPWSGALYEPMQHFKKNICDYIEVLNEQGAVVCRESVPKGPRPAGVPEKQIDALVEFIGETAAENHLHAERLWLDPLPSPKDEEKKSTVYETDIVPFVLNPIIGMYDNLAEQKHLPLTIPFTTQGNALLYGSAGSGKLEFLNKMIISIMENHSPEEVRFSICDFDSGALAAFEDSSYLRGYAAAGDEHALREVLHDLTYEINMRREQMRRYGGNYQTYIKSSGKTMPNILLVVDNYQNLVECDNEARTIISQIAREGTRYGMFLIITGTTGSSIPYSIQPLFRNIYTLQQNSDDQYREIVGKTDGITPEGYRGRGLVRADGTVCEFQTDIVFEDAENTYEAIQDFCERIDQKWKGTQESAAEQKGTEESAAGQKHTEESAAGQKLTQEPAAVQKRAQEPVQAQKAKPSILENLEFKMDSIPIGISRKSRQLVSYDWTKKISTIFIYDHAHEKESCYIKDSFIKALPENAKRYELNSDSEELDNQIEDIWGIMQQRAKEGKAAKAEGREIPEFSPVFVAVNQPTAIVDSIEETQRVHLMAMIIKLTPAYRIYFLIKESADNISNLMQGKCLSGLFPVNQGLILTADKGVQVLFEEDIQFQNSARAPYGYVVQNGEAVLTEIINLEGGKA